MGMDEVQTVDIARHDDAVRIGVFVDHNAVVIAGHDYIAKDGPCPVTAGRRDDAAGAMGWFGGLHIVYISVHKHVLDFALRRVLQIDAVDTGIVIGSDIQIPENRVDPGKNAIQFLRLVIGVNNGGPDLSRHLRIVPFFCNGIVPIVPNTGVGSLSPAISRVTHFLVPGIMILPR